MRINGSATLVASPAQAGGAVDLYFEREWTARASLGAVAVPTDPTVYRRILIAGSLENATNVVWGSLAQSANRNWNNYFYLIGQRMQPSGGWAPASLAGTAGPFPMTENQGTQLGVSWEIEMWRSQFNAAMPWDGLINMRASNGQFAQFAWSASAWHMGFEGEGLGKIRAWGERA